MNSFKQKPSELHNFLDLIEEDLKNVRRVKQFCQKNDLDVSFEIHPKAETVDESVQHSPVEKEQIVKTLIFKMGDDFVAVMAPGNERVDTDKLEAISGEEDIRMANPEEVERQTGYVIGGVSPFDLELDIYMEEELLVQEKVRPAAGSRVVGVEISPRDLKEVSDSKASNLTN